MTLWRTHEKTLVAEPRGCSHRSDEGSANTPTNQMMTEENAMTTVENPRSFRNLLNSITMEAAADLPVAVIDDLETLIPWHELSLTTAQRLLSEMLRQASEELRVEKLTAHLPVPVWATCTPDKFVHNSEDDTTRRCHDIESIEVPATNLGADDTFDVLLTGTEFVGQRSVFSVQVRSNGGEYLSARQARSLSAALLDAASKADALDLSQ